jgi:Na+-translocating ferredoxin:NAD+ oxidoreductase subunit B
MVLLIAGLFLLAITAIFAGLLGYAKVKLHVEVDPRVEQVKEALPAANCGGCGFAGCDDFARAVVEERAPIDGCPVGGPTVAAAIAKILGKEMQQSWPYRPVIHCRAHTGDKHGVVPYDGVQTCAEANVVGVTQACVYGCLGFGDCVRACKYDAMRMVDGLPEVIYDKCTGCGACVEACPRDLIEKIPFKQEQMLVVACNNKEPGKNVKQVCDVGCIGCKACQRMMEGLFQVENNLAYIDYDNYSGEEDFEAVMGKCPAKSLVYFGKPKPEYAEQLKKEEAMAE